MRRWQVTRVPGCVTLSRPGRARFDVSAAAAFPQLRPVVLAHEIRKDLWRMLQDLRGFSPVVEIRDAGPGLEVRAGGALPGGTRPAPGTGERIEGLLADPDKRARWIAHARLKC
ncbi:hypothetical protein [Mangrovicoccus sp. HB161399]|uniref:hypothetical protein n=1 Tax=Mangrovicoccus sp. HB161399 TaxID=2720392 RepID=UPI001553EEF4|nr:hypothetical protein [Mangrovicoccus sp. HB161399]